MRPRAIGAWILVLAAAACDGAATGPRIASSTPPYGPLVGGTRITLTGAGFTADGAAPNRVLIAGRQAPLAAAADDATLEVVIPAGEQPGDAEVVVLNDLGNARATGVFHYSAPPAITSIAPADVVFSSSSTLVTVTGSGFLDEGAGAATVAIDGRLVTDVQVTSDTSLTFTAPPGRVLVQPDLELGNGRGITARPRAFRYTPGPRPGLLLFPTFGTFAVFLDPSDNSTVTIPWIASPAVRFTAVVRDGRGDYWAIDRSRRFGRIDMRTQRLEAPVQVPAVIPAMVRAGNDYFALERSSQSLGKVDPLTGSFTTISAIGAIPCCGSYGLALDGTTLRFTARQGASVTINTIDGTTGVVGTPVTITAAAGFHVEDMRSFAGTLYASSRNGTLVTIDPTTGTTAVLPVSLGRFNAIEIFE